MASTLFTLEALNAKEGDCLILHYGDATRPKFIVIDGGPRGVYAGFLRKRLLQIKETMSPQRALPIELLMISHIDDDHIVGAVDLTDEMVGLGEKKEEMPFELLQVWYNSFDDLVSRKQDTFLASLGEHATNALSTGSLADLFGLDTWEGAVVASVQNGRRLRDNARKLDLFVNPGFDRLVMTSSPPKVAKWDGLELTILGPDRDRLRVLQEVWDEEIRKLKKAGKLGKAAMVELAALAKKGEDKSPYNLSSIVVLAEMKAKKMLLTGDALGQYITEGLEKAGKMNNGKIHVDLLKMPHHGSSRNITAEFFQKVTADQYVFSADGKYRNPDIASLEKLVQSRPNDDLNLYFTNHDGEDAKTGFQLGPALDQFFVKEKQRGRNHHAVFRDASRDKSDAPATLLVNLLDGVAY